MPLHRIKEKHLMWLAVLVQSIILFIYFHGLILNINSVLCGASGDSLKNYYTFCFHAVRDTSPLVFNGMNFPFSEHVVYTDGQPLLSTLLMPLTFLHDCPVGVLHTLMLLSFAVTPAVIFTIFLRTGLDRFTAFFCALAVSVLSPQIQRIGGHFSLAYGCVIPLIIFLLSSIMRDGLPRHFILLLIVCTMLFFIHPYFGFGASMFSFFTLLIYFLADRSAGRIKHLLLAVGTTLLPVLLFKIFMFLTDNHPSRPDQPYGAEIMVANIESVFTPFNGPFRHFMQQIIKVRKLEWEGLSYVGIFLFFMLLPAAILIFLKKYRPQRAWLALFAASAVLLMFSFGIHLSVMNWTGINIPFLRQFRAPGRFAWYFYFTLPLVVVPVLYHSAQMIRRNSFRRTIIILIPFLYAALNITEGHAQYRLMTAHGFTERNIFNEDCLTSSETAALEAYRQKPFDAILPLPMFHTGSEVFTRGGNVSVYPAFLFSYHLNKPIMGVMMSRTSVSETRMLLEATNETSRNRPILSLLAGKRLMLLANPQRMQPHEIRYLERRRTVPYLDSLMTGIADAVIPDNFAYHPGAGGSFIFVRDSAVPPFSTGARLDQPAKVFHLRNTKLPPGKYVVSLHYNMPEESYRSAATLNIVRKHEQTETTLTQLQLMETASFCGNTLVIEGSFEIEPGCDYDFIITGNSPLTYTVRNFLIRPVVANIETVSGRDTLHNNYFLQCQTTGHSR
jgi:hypothetical protein